MDTSVADTDKLDAEELATLGEYEADIANACSSVFDIAWSVFQIYSERLYRQSHPTISAYCEEKWDFSKAETTRYKLIGEVLAELDDASRPPTSEWQCRELARFEPGTRNAVWQELVAASADGSVSAADIRDYADQMLPPAEKTPESEQAATLLKLKRFSKTIEELASQPMTAEIHDLIQTIADQLIPLIITGLANSSPKTPQTTVACSGTQTEATSDLSPACQGPTRDDSTFSNPDGMTTTEASRVSRNEQHFAGSNPVQNVQVHASMAATCLDNPIHPVEKSQQMAPATAVERGVAASQPQQHDAGRRAPPGRNS